MPRASKRTPEVIEHILYCLRRGEPLASILRESEALPTVQGFMEWVRADEALALAYAGAREDGEDVIAVQALEIWDEPPQTYATEHGVRVDPAFVQHQRNRAEGRLKLLKVWNPKRWGDKIDLAHSGAMTVTIAADVAKVG